MTEGLGRPSPILCGRAFSHIVSIWASPLLFSGGNLFSAYFRGGGWGLERLSDLSQVTCLRNRGDWFKSKTLCISVHYSFPRGKDSNKLGSHKCSCLQFFSGPHTIPCHPWHHTRQHCLDINCTLCAFVFMVFSSWNLLSSHYLLHLTDSWVRTSQVLFLPCPLPWSIQTAF